MKYIAIALSLIFCISFGQTAFAVKVKDDANSVIIEGAKYTLHWKKAAQMGYWAAFIEGSAKSVFGANPGRVMYHSANYAGWKDWGATKSWKTIKEGPGAAVVEYNSNDGLSKEYMVTATYYDNANFVKHEVKAKNVGNNPVKSFSDGHEPMLEPRGDKPAGYKAWEKPIPHVAFWTKDGYFVGLYAGSDKAKGEVFEAFDAAGRMHLVHDALGADIKPGDTSSAIVYYVAFGKGGEKEADALADQVTKPVSVVSVDPQGKLAATWGAIKNR